MPSTATAKKRNKKSVEAQEAELLTSPAEILTENGEPVPVPEEPIVAQEPTYPDLRQVILPNVVAFVSVYDLYIDDAISGRVFGRDPHKFQETKQSIKERGQLEPVMVGLDSQRGWGILYSGHGRVRAIRELYEEGAIESPNVKAILYDADVKDGYIAGVHSNTKRDPLNPIQMGEIVETLTKPPFSMSVDMIAQELGIVPSYVREYRKTQKLPTEIKTAIADGRIGIFTAIELGKVKDPKQQLAVARKLLTLPGRGQSSVARKEVRQITGKNEWSLKEVKAALDYLSQSESLTVPQITLCNLLYDGIRSKLSLKQIESKATSKDYVRAPETGKGKDKGKGKNPAPAKKAAAKKTAEKAAPANNVKAKKKPAKKAAKKKAS